MKQSRSSPHRSSKRTASAPRHVPKRSHHTATPKNKKHMNKKASKSLQSLHTPKRSMSTFITPISHGIKGTAQVDPEIQHYRDISKIQSLEESLLLSRVNEPQQYVPSMLISTSFEQARHRNVAFYRKILRLIPFLTKHYELQYIPPMEIARAVRYQFDKHKDVTSPESMDALRWDAEVQLVDIARMFYTTTHVWGALYVDKHPGVLPRLPTAALPPTTSQERIKLDSNASAFLEAFLDPMITQRRLRDGPEPSVI